MAGYAEDYSKSNRAIEAEEENRYPISTISEKLKISATILRRHFSTSEWHHTSSFYNETDYYDLTEIEEAFEKDPELEKKLRVEDKEYKKELREKREDDKKNEIRHTNGTIRYEESYGTRNNLRWKSYEYTGVFIERGDFLYFKENGKINRKKKNGKRIEYTSAQIRKQERLEKAAEKEESKLFKAYFEENFDNLMENTIKPYIEKNNEIYVLDYDYYIDIDNILERKNSDIHKIDITKNKQFKKSCQQYMYLNPKGSLEIKEEILGKRERMFGYIEKDGFAILDNICYISKEMAEKIKQANALKNKEKKKRKNKP